MNLNEARMRLIVNSCTMRYVLTLNFPDLLKRTPSSWTHWMASRTAGQSETACCIMRLATCDAQWKFSARGWRSFTLAWHPLYWPSMLTAPSYICLGSQIVSRQWQAGDYIENHFRDHFPRCGRQLIQSHKLFMYIQIVINVAEADSFLFDSSDVLCPINHYSEQSIFRNLCRKCSYYVCTEHLDHLFLGLWRCEADWPLEISVKSFIIIAEDVQQLLEVSLLSCVASKINDRPCRRRNRKLLKTFISARWAVSCCWRRLASILTSILASGFKEIAAFATLWQFEALWLSNVGDAFFQLQKPTETNAGSLILANFKSRRFSACAQ